MKAAVVGIGIVITSMCALPRAARAWQIGSQLNPEGCHELITAEALRRARAMYPDGSVAPAITPTRDERAMIDDIIFSPPAGTKGDLAAMSLVIGVRDNDLKGNDPLHTLELQLVHGNPATQEEHCIRRSEDDGSPAGDMGALAACRAYIRDTAAAALDGLDATGAVDATNRVPLKFYTQVAGTISPPLPLFYVKIADAMHAFEDGFTHVYRDADGSHVTTVLNWIDFAKTPYDEAKDGPPHRPELDDCRNTQEPVIARNRELATQAAAELLAIALDPARSRDAKLADIDALTGKYLAYEPGCDATNDWCDPDDAHVTATETIPLLGCSAGGDGGGAAWGGALVVVIALALGFGARASRRGMFAAGVLVLGAARVASADPIVETESGGTTKIVEKTAAGDTSNWAFASTVGASFERAGAVASVGVRYRISDRWLVGADVGWNPWFATSPPDAKAGVATYALTAIRRWPMKYAKVNLRTTVHLGASTLLFDVYDVPRYSTGPYAAVCPLGLDVDIGKRTRFIFDPFEFSMPVPHVGQIPLWYEQFQVVAGIQVGI